MSSSATDLPFLLDSPSDEVIRTGLRNQEAAAIVNQSDAQAVHERHCKDTPMGANPAQELVPISEHVVFLSLVANAAEALRVAMPDDLSILVDAHTAANARAMAELAGASNAVRVATRAAGAPDAESDEKHIPWPETCGTKDHFLVVVSPHIHLLICGTADLRTDDHAATFGGAWTVEPRAVSTFARGLFPAGEGAIDTATPTVRDSGVAAAIAMGLMASQSGDLVARQRDMALERADLFSVLNILKAISSRRRSHDVLYVFVEQIANVITADRCSVVRVWGGANQAKVLASHEDASVEDITIDLRKYPELLTAMDTHRKVVVQDVEIDPITRGCVDDLRSAGIRALLVIPIVLFDDHVGTLLLRAARHDARFTPRELSFFEIVAEAASNALERAHLFESIQQANERLEQLAITDSLTGLYNRRYLHEQFEQEFQRALRYGLSLACILLDIDDFKYINDEYGHLQGDSILQELAERIRRNVRSIDIAARYGGEEIILVMPQTDMEGACTEAERLRSVISDHPYRGLNGGTSVTVSIGVAILDTASMRSPDDLVRVTDTRLYVAKRSGKNRVVCHDSEGEN